jgi:hypothetical protein
MAWQSRRVGIQYVGPDTKPSPAILIEGDSRGWGGEIHEKAVHIFERVLAIGVPEDRKRIKKRRGQPSGPSAAGEGAARGRVIWRKFFPCKNTC